MDFMPENAPKMVLVVSLVCLAVVKFCEVSEICKALDLFFNKAVSAHYKVCYFLSLNPHIYHIQNLFDC